jgi:hypothetical protein
MMLEQTGGKMARAQEWGKGASSIRYGGRSTGDYLIYDITMIDRGHGDKMMGRVMQKEGQ